MLARIQPFYINVEFDRKKHRLRVEQTDYDERAELFTVQAKNGVLIYSRNRPYLREARLKHRAPVLKIESGSLKFTYLEVAIAQAIIDAVMKMERQANKR